MNDIAILCDAATMGYDQRDPSLFKLTDYIHCYPYPSIEGDGFGNIAGWEGDHVFIKVPFKVKSQTVNGVQPIIQSVTVSVLAVKAGQPDFKLETNTFNTSLIPFFRGVQNIQIKGTKGLVTYPNDPFNLCNLQLTNQPDPAVPGLFAGYTLSYGLVLRYEFWRNVLNSLTGGTSGAIAGDISTINQAWANYNQQGWRLVFRFSISISGYDGYVTTWEGQTNIECKPIGAPADGVLQFVRQTIFYDTNNDVIPFIQEGAKTRIRNIYTPNGSLPNQAPYGTIFIDVINTGGIMAQRFASSEKPSEAGSPFGPSANIAGASTQYANGNMRIGFFTSGVVITETIIDTNNPSVINWNNLMAVGRLGFTTNLLYLVDEDGNYILDEYGNKIFAF